MSVINNYKMCVYNFGFGISFGETAGSSPRGFGHPFGFCLGASGLVVTWSGTLVSSSSATGCAGQGLSFGFFALRLFGNGRRGDRRGGRRNLCLAWFFAPGRFRVDSTSIDSFRLSLGLFGLFGHRHVRFRNSLDAYLRRVVFVFVSVPCALRVQPAQRFVGDDIPQPAANVRARTARFRDEPPRSAGSGTRQRRPVTAETRGVAFHVNGSVRLLLAENRGKRRARRTCSRGGRD